MILLEHFSYIKINLNSNDYVATEHSVPVSAKSYHNLCKSLSLSQATLLLSCASEQGSLNSFNNSFIKVKPPLAACTPLVLLAQPLSISRCLVCFIGFVGFNGGKDTGYDGFVLLSFYAKNERMKSDCI